LSVSPKVLTSRLQELAELGVVIRKSHDEIPPRVEYELSAKGRDLLLRVPVDLKASTVTFPAEPGKMFEELQAWTEKYSFAEQSAKRQKGVKPKTNLS
jgi:DNA-binding PadR family transcriptional regulator